MITGIGGLGGSSVSLAKALRDYQVAWKAFVVVHRLDVLASLAIPTTLSWKVADKAALYANLEVIGAHAEQIHIGTVNNRFIASAVLHDAYDGMYIIKLLERRPGSDDPLGLDSIDHLVKDPEEIYHLFKASGAHVRREHNHSHNWLSVRFGKNLEYEAKFVDQLVLDVAIRELQQTNLRLLKSIQS